jgi:hypothetical protein
MHQVTSEVPSLYLTLDASARMLAPPLDPLAAACHLPESLDSTAGYRYKYSKIQY